MTQQNKLESEIHQIQEKREAERIKLVEQLQEGQSVFIVSFFP
jgi:preprotein translocase subunit YajC